MSVNFWFEGDSKINEIYECQCDGLNTNCYFCHGTGEVNYTSDEHGVNFSNGNAAFMLERLDIKYGDPDWCGEIDADRLIEKMHTVISCCLFGPASIKSRAEALLRLGKAAKAAGKPVIYG